MCNRLALYKRTAPGVMLTLAIFVSLPAVPNIQGQAPGSDAEKLESAFPSASTEAQANKPPPNYGSIYVLRPKSSLGALGCFGLTIDGKLWGSLNNGEYAWDPISPGDHVMGRARPKQYHLHVDAGKTYYIVISAGGLGTGGVKFISEAEGEKIRHKLRLNESRWLLHQYLANWPKIRIGMNFAEVSSLLKMDSMYRLDFSYMYASNGAISQFGNGNISIPVVPVDKVSVYRSDVIWYSLTFRDDMLIAKRDAQLSPTKGPAVEYLEGATVRGMVDGVSYAGGILNKNGETAIQMTPLVIPFCPGFPEWY